MTDPYYPPVQRQKYPPPRTARDVLPTMTRNQAAAHYGVSHHTIRKWADELGVQTRELTYDERCEMARNGGRTRRMNAGQQPAGASPEQWARDLYLQALKAFDVARSPITEDDYA